MKSGKGKWKKHVIIKAWEGWRQSGRLRVPKGSFPVFVGAEKQRMVMKTQMANHPLFKKLLEEAELEYGFSSNEGPLCLPCSVDAFYEASSEMEQQMSVLRAGYFRL